jgi:ribosomal protein L12E/L44/L45/RPP1/RPP2
MNEILLNSVKLQELCSRIFVESDPNELAELVRALEGVLRVREEILRSHASEVAPIRFQ